MMSFPAFLEDLARVAAPRVVPVGRLRRCCACRLPRPARSRYHPPPAACPSSAGFRDVQRLCPASVSDGCPPLGRACSAFSFRVKVSSGATDTEQGHGKHDK